MFNEAIVSNFIPNETMIFNDRNPAWLHKTVKNIINYKNAIYKTLTHHNDRHLKLHLRYFIQKLKKLRGSTLKIYLISYRTKISTLKSTGHSLKSNFG